LSLPSSLVFSLPPSVTFLYIFLSLSIRFSVSLSLSGVIRLFVWPRLSLCLWLVCLSLFLYPPAVRLFVCFWWLYICVDFSTSILFFLCKHPAGRAGGTEFDAAVCHSGHYRGRILRQEKKWFKKIMRPLMRGFNFSEPRGHHWEGTPKLTPFHLSTGLFEEEEEEIGPEPWR